MHIFGLEVRRAQQEEEMTQTRCFKCGTEIYIYNDNLRVYNYCPSCK